MTIFQKKDGKWVIQFMHKGKVYTCYSPEGTRHSFAKKADAREYAPHFHAQVMMSLGEKKAPPS